MARSLTVISLLFQSTTHCRYRVYTKFLLTYTAIYQRNRKVLPLGITALQPQSHFHLGTPYTRHACSYPDSNILEPDTLHNDHPNVYAIHRRYSSAPSSHCAIIPGGGAPFSQMLFQFFFFTLLKWHYVQNCASP